MSTHVQRNEIYKEFTWTFRIQFEINLIPYINFTSAKSIQFRCRMFKGFYDVKPPRKFKNTWLYDILQKFHTKMHILITQFLYKHLSLCSLEYLNKVLGLLISTFYILWRSPKTIVIFSLIIAEHVIEITRKTLKKMISFDSCKLDHIYA